MPILEVSGKGLLLKIPTLTELHDKNRQFMILRSVNYVVKDLCGIGDFNSDGPFSFQFMDGMSEGFYLSN